MPLVSAPSTEVPGLTSCPFCKAELTGEGDTLDLQRGHSRDRDQNCPCRENLKKSVCATRTAAETLTHQHNQILVWASFHLAFRLETLNRNLLASDPRQKPPRIAPNPDLPAILRC